MTVKYYAILTNQGAARLANATMLGSKLNLTQMAVGDANGVLPTPDPAQTKLINQKRIAPLNLLSVDPNNQSQIIAEQIIPENEGGFWIREIGLYDDEGVLIAVANCPETYKPQLQEGSGRTQTIRMILVVTNTEAITLKIDPSVVLATRKYVDDEVLELRLYVDDQMRNHIAAQDPHTQYAQKHNPTFTGEPKAPTPAAGNNTTRIATTAFVQAAITALINGAPATLDTLKEIAAAINNDPKFSTTINNALSGKQPLDETLTHLSGKDVAGLLAYLGLGEAAIKRNVGTGYIRYRIWELHAFCFRYWISKITIRFYSSVGHFLGKHTRHCTGCSNPFPDIAFPNRCLRVLVHKTTHQIAGLLVILPVQVLVSAQA
ncbi:phage tail protein [Escherichia coli]|uniref:phage tail protein n=1 Tax=Escherichia coli TaxID=562 RepID=UPI0030D1FCB0